MRLRHVVSMVVGLAALGVAGFCAWLYTIPGTTAVYAPAPILDVETRATLAALQPPHRKRPLIGVIGGNLGTQTETADYLVPYGVLKRADVADVIALATAMAPVKLYPAFKVLPQATVGRFDEDYPTGADYVIVPAMSRDDDPQVLSWLRAQAGKGAIIVGVGAGAKIVAAAGLLEGKRATTHWQHAAALRDAHPTLRFTADRRFVVDGRIVTTTGTSATIPMMLTLIEAIAGLARATQIARDIGVESWDARHVSAAFASSRPVALTTLRNSLARDEPVGIELVAGVDEVALALRAEAWSQTRRSRAVSYVAAAGTVQTRGGLQLIPDAVPGEAMPFLGIVAANETTPTGALDAALSAIAKRYGTATADLTALQLEYPRRP